MTNEKTKILIVDRDDAGAAHLEGCLTGLGYTVCAAAACGRRAMAEAAQARPDLALVDIGLAGEVTGTDVTERLGCRFDVPVVYVFEEGDAAAEELMQRAAASDPFGYVMRPFAESQLRVTIETALVRHARERALREAKSGVQRNADRLEQLNVLMKTIFDSMSEGVVAIGEDLAPLFSNASAQRICDNHLLDTDVRYWTERCRIFQSDMKTVIPPEENPLLAALQGRSTDDAELFVRNEQKPEGVHMRVSGRPLTGKRGEANGATIVFRDVTGQKRADAELERTVLELRYQSDLMDTTFRSISDGIVVANAAGEFLYVNPAAEEIVGMGGTDRPQDEWAATYGTFHPDRETPMVSEDLPLIRAIHRGESVDEEDVFIRNHNRPSGVYIRVSARPLLNSVGGIRGGVIVFRDVTERVFADEALALAFAEGRLEIVDTILHNIGNAITRVTTGIETVRRNLADDRIGRRLDALAAALGEHRDDWLDYLRNDPRGRKVLPFIIALAADFATRNAAMIKTVGRVRDRANHIADIVRTQKALGTADAARKDVNLLETLSAAVRVLRDSLAKRGIRTRINCRRAPREIRVRESLFHQMLVNLIKNAMEAIDDLAAAQGLAKTPHIRIQAWSEERFFILEVADNGIGIRTTDTRLLFSPGYTTKPAGSGLGLHSAANYVIASGGRIEPLSEGAGKGTTMRVLLPLSAVVLAGDGRDTDPRTAGEPGGRG